MQRRKFLLFLIMIFIFPHFCWGSTEDKRVLAAIKVLSKVMKGPEGKAPRYLLAHSRGVLILPGVKKIGFIAGVKRGKGIIVLKDKNNNWLPPSFISIHGGSFGFQIGAKSSDILIILMTDKAVKQFSKNKIKLGADIGIAAGPVGKEIGISQENLFKVDAFSYVYEKGLFAGAILSGSVISQDENANANFYGEKITLNDIINGRKVKLPPVAVELLKTLKNFCENKGTP